MTVVKFSADTFLFSENKSVQSNYFNTIEKAVVDIVLKVF